MHNSDQGKQDQNHSHVTRSEDSNSMTVEFLRARLLSERAVSRTARERADELAKRVMELEEQLKIVMLQRKKAEKAAAEVVAILEDNGISDTYEANDSSSEHEGVYREFEEGNTSNQEEEIFKTVKPGKLKELPCRDLETSSPTQRSLSWKSCSGSPDSIEKMKCTNRDNRQSHNLANAVSSSIQQVGKSCRQIKPKEMRSALIDIRNDPLPHASQDNGLADGYEDVLHQKDRSEMLNGESMNEAKGHVRSTAPCPQEYERKEFGKHGRRGLDMERALEDQAQLIGLYEAEENAQREWEEKFKENNSCSPDSCEPGNQSDTTDITPGNRSDITDMTEEDDIGKETVEPDHGSLTHGERAKSEPEGVCFNRDAIAETLPNRNLPTAIPDTACLQDRHPKNAMNGSLQTSLPEFSFPLQGSSAANGNRNLEQDWPENNSSQPTSSGSSEHQQAQHFSTGHVGESSWKGGSTGSGNKLQVEVHREAPSGLGGVLESLQRAKLSLKHEINMLPQASQRAIVVRMPESPAPDTMAGDAREFPTGCAGLFRVPTGAVQSDTFRQANLLGPSSNSDSSLARYYPDAGVRIAGDQYPSRPNLEMRLRNSISSSSSTPFNDPHLNTMALPPSIRNTYQLYTDLVPRMPNNDQMPGPYSNVGPSTPNNYRTPGPHSNAGPHMAVEDRYSAFGDQFWPNVHHRTL